MEKISICLFVLIGLGCAAVPVHQAEIINNPEQEQLQIEQQWVEKLQYISNHLQPMELSQVYTLKVKHLWDKGVTLHQLLQEGHFNHNPQNPQIAVGEFTFPLSKTSLQTYKIPDDSTGSRPVGYFGLKKDAIENGQQVLAWIMAVEDGDPDVEIRSTPFVESPYYIYTYPQIPLILQY